MLILSIKKKIILVIALIAILQAIEVSYVPFIASKAEQFARCVFSNNATQIIERTCTQKEEYTCVCEEAFEGTEIKDWQVAYNNGSQILALGTYINLQKQSDRYEWIVISFRATIVLTNVLEDAAIWQSQVDYCKGCKIHKGFKYSYDSIQPKIKAIYDDLTKKYPNAKLLITGQSLGAALANIFAIDIAKNDPSRANSKNLLVYTFGQPRIGNKHIAQFSNEKMTVYRVNNFNDPVPHFVWGSKGIIKNGYFHPGVEVWYKKGITQMNCSIQSKTSPEKPSFCVGDNDDCSNSADVLKSQSFSLMSHITYNCTAIGTSTIPTTLTKDYDYSRSLLSLLAQVKSDFVFLAELSGQILSIGAIQMKKKIQAQIHEVFFKKTEEL